MTFMIGLYVEVQAPARCFITGISTDDRLGRVWRDELCVCRIERRNFIEVAPAKGISKGGDNAGDGLRFGGGWRQRAGGEASERGYDDED
jgi:hypothetical protein